MAYTKYYSDGWRSGEEGGTPITPAALNHMENGIVDANAIGNPVDVPHGGTGATTAAAARTNLGITLSNLGGVSASAPNITRGIYLLTNNNYYLAPSGTVYNFLEIALDDNNENRGGLYSIRNTNGSYGTKIVTRMPTSGDSIWEEFGPYITTNGTVGYSVGTPSALRNAISAVSKAGDTMTGNLTINNPSAPSILFKAASGTYPTGDVYNTPSSDGGYRMALLVRKSPSSDANEVYFTPNATATSGNNFYYLLTTKDLVTVPQGGTGANNAQSARVNLQTPYVTIIAYENNEGWGSLWSELSKIYIGGAGIITLNGHAMSILSGGSNASNGKITNTCTAVIQRFNLSNNKSRFRVMAMSDSGHYQYSFRIEDADSSSRSTGTIYQFTGTAI